jgi:pseudaminic acid cytidylyltransferase
MTNLAIIPARGGSKRIPRKNIKDFLGKPIIAYSIEAALTSGLFDEVMVSTDDEEIAEVARKYGAKVPFLRSKANADDFSTTIDVLKEVELTYKQKINKTFDFICCIYPTAPLISSKQLNQGFELIKKEKVEVVFPIVLFSYPIWRGVEIIEGKTQMVWPEYINSRSQDLKKVYHDAGQWYWYNPTKIRQTLFTENTSSIILNEQEVQDIDTLIDWNLAEMKYKLLNV